MEDKDKLNFPRNGHCNSEPVNWSRPFGLPNYWLDEYRFGVGLGPTNKLTWSSAV